MPPKSCTEVDRFVGQRVRMLRLMAGLSQTALGEKLGVTFQQVQKYEKGVNRIGAGRLAEIAEILQRPVGYFYDEGQGRTAKKQTDLVQTMLATTGGLSLAEAYLAIQNPAVRRAIVAQIKAIAAGMGEPEARPRKKMAA